MNDLFRPNGNDVIGRKRLDGPMFDREIEEQPARRTQVRRRRGGDVCLRSADHCCLLAASRWVDGETIR